MPAAKKSPVAVRKDPKSKPVNSGSPYFDLVNQDPEKKYVWVYKAAAEMGVDYYRDAMGYEPVQFVKGGVKPRVGKILEPGQYIEAMGHILMFISHERAVEIEENGVDGQGGQAHADLVEQKMRNSKKSIAELSRNIAFRSAQGGEYFDLQAERGSIAMADTGAD
jgi:hypothetical protein